MSKLDFDLQCAALQQQLLKAKVGVISPPSPKQQSQIIRKTFAKHLTGFRLSPSISPITSLAQANPFRDRAYYLDNLESFLRGDKSLAFVVGGALVGKSALIRDVLSRRAYDKQVVMLDVNVTSSIWNLIEQFLVGLGCRFEADIYSGLKNISFNDIKNEIGQFIRETCGRVIIGVDHFERLLDPEDHVQDPEIRDFFALVANEPHSKLIITTRRVPDLGFIQSDRLFQIQMPPMGRFPEGAHHVENVLNDFVNRAQLGIDRYPDLLLQAIDRHPYLTVLAGMTIRKKGIGSLSDSEFFEKVRQNMREALLRDLVDEHSRPTIELLSVLRTPVPREMLESLTGKDSVNAAEEAGLVYVVYDRVRDDLITGLGVIRRFVGSVDDFISADESDELDKKLASEHTRIAECYERLYRTDHDPRWVRELHYHRFSTGDPSTIGKFGVLYRDEIFWAGDYWFRQLKNYKAALWAFDAARKLGLTNVHADMRRASCMIRLRDPEGAELFSELVARYPNAKKIKSSHVDSLLYLNQHEIALNKLIEYKLAEHDDAWIAHEYGKAYFGLSKFQDAVRAFEIQLSKEREPEPFVYDNLARAHQQLGEAEHESRVLTAGLRRHPNSGRLKLRYASSLIRMGTDAAFNEAYPILTSLYQAHTTDGRVLQQYCKLLCLTNRVSDAELIWQSVGDKIFPAEYKIPIHVEILIRKEKWADALEVFTRIHHGKDIHSIGQQQQVYLAWARAESDEIRRREIAKQGLDVKVYPAFDTNIPYLLTAARLARLAGNDDLYEELADKVKKINAKVAELLWRDEDQIFSWEDDIIIPPR